LETFDTGPVLLRSEDSYSHQVIEVSVESETDGLDEDQLQLSLHLYRGGKPHPLRFVPTAVVTMKSEKDIWRLDDIAVNLRLPLGDQEFLDSLTPDRHPSQLEDLEATALNHLRTINAAEVSYAATFPELGFACTIADLGGAGEPTPGSAGLIDAGLSSGRLDGYIISIEVCSGSPVDGFSISAVPEDRQSGLRAFCSDESGIIRFSDDGSGNTCLSAGDPVP
jgi:type IV pilus assembly protein PilA